MLGDVATTVGFELASTHLFPLLEALVRDEEFVVRQNVAQQLAILAQVCHAKQAAEGEVRHTCLTTSDFVTYATTDVFHHWQCWLLCYCGETSAAPC